MDDRGVHNLYKQLVSSGHAFGAKRWIATLDRQCERLASAMATNIPTVDVGGINTKTHLFVILFKHFFNPKKFLKLDSKSSLSLKNYEFSSSNFLNTLLLVRFLL